MSAKDVLNDPGAFSEVLLDKMKRINPGFEEMEPYEFRYCLDNLVPERGWDGVELDPEPAIEERVGSAEFYRAVELKPRLEGRIVLDEQIVQLTVMLLAGLARGVYSEEWVRRHFYFDIRGFFFLHRTVYFTPPVVAHLGGRPFQSFERRQQRLDRCQDIGYQAFRKANDEVDQAFIQSVRRLIAARGTPILVAIAGPTAAGKTEIVARLRDALEQTGQTATAIEMDNFLTDRDRREEKGIHSLGKAALHFDLFLSSLEQIAQGRRIATPRYDFVYATSSHDLDGRLKPGCVPLEIEPAGVVFVEGNAPWLHAEVAPKIGVRAVYLTADDIRLKRKWKRDIDYRKKYEPTYFRNRFFRDQFLMAQGCYIPQMAAGDLVVDTSGAALWATPAVAEILGAG